MHIIIQVKVFVVLNFITSFFVAFQFVPLTQLVYQTVSNFSTTDCQRQHPEVAMKRLKDG